FQAGGLVSGAEYMQAQRIRSEIQRETATVLEQVDVLATPTAPKPATPCALATDPEFGFPRSNMAPFNITGLPTLALPCGFSSSGLPLSRTRDRKSTRLNSSHVAISYAVFCLKKKTMNYMEEYTSQILNMTYIR